MKNYFFSNLSALNTDLNYAVDAASSLSGYATEQYVQDYVEQHGGGSSGEISACLSSLEFTDEEYLPTDPFGNLDIDSISLTDIGNKVNKILQLLKRDSAGPGGGDPTKTYVKYNDGTKNVLALNGGIESSSIPNINNAVDVKIGNTVTMVGKKTFDGCSNLKSVSFNNPPQISHLEDECFRECTNLNSITLPQGVWYIGLSAFLSCVSLKEISIPSSVQVLADRAFDRCSSLSSVYFEGGYNSSLPNRLFSNCTNLVSVNIPNNVKGFGDFMFQNCSSLSSLTLPLNLYSFGTGSFYGCSSLTYLRIPDSFTAMINQYEFGNCSSLSVIDFGTTRTTIPSMSYVSASSQSSPFYGLPNDYKIYVPSDLVDTWKSSGNWTKYASHIEAHP